MASLLPRRAATLALARRAARRPWSAPARALGSPAAGTAVVPEAELRRPLRIKTVKPDGSTQRFYGAAGVCEVFKEPSASSSASQAAPTEFAVMLDGRPVLTPGGRRMAVPTRALAAALAVEWEAQEKRVKPTSMPLVTLATTALDQMQEKREAVLEALYRFAVTDTVCFRASEGEASASLVQLQQKHWDPLLEWALKEYGVTLKTTTHIAGIDQPEHALGRLWTQVNLMDDWHLAVLDALASTTKSMLISLALMRGRLTVQQAYNAARVDEDWQIRNYGQVDGVYGHGIDIAHTRMQLAAGRTFVNLLEGVHGDARGQGMAGGEEAPQPQAA